MTMCASCSGRGDTTCHSCGGRGTIQRLTSNGDMDISTCLVCGGKRRIRCQFCGGRGTVGPDMTAPMPPKRARPRAPDEDALEGRWAAAQGGGYYELVKDGSQYSVTEYGPMGETGSGRATRSGDVVTLHITNMLLGAFTLSLRLKGDALHGSLNVMGIPMPFVLTRE